MTTDRLRLDYVIEGNTDAMAMPASGKPSRADNLWQTTCCEAFLRLSDRTGYFEINLSPSRRWAVYRFSDYREGMRSTAVGEAPNIETMIDPGMFGLSAEIDLAPLGADLFELDLEIGLSVIVEDRSGAKSFWALRHPEGKPDFHHKDCFALKLAPPKRP